MEEDKLQAVTKDEKLQVGFSYLIGWIPALVFWIQNKGKSAYVRFHTMQAILFSGVIAVFVILAMVVTMTLTTLFAIMIPLGILLVTPQAQFDPHSLAAILTTLFVLGAFFSPFILLAPVQILQLINLGAVIEGFSGRDWRYPLLAKWAEKINQRDLMTSRRNVQ